MGIPKGLLTGYICGLFRKKKKIESRWKCSTGRTIDEKCSTLIAISEGAKEDNDRE